MGLSLGWMLAERGCAVDLFEMRSEPGGASWAAAGMLGLCAELDPRNETMVALNRLSAALWPDFQQRLEAAAGAALPIDTTGTLVVRNLDDTGLKQHFERLSAHNLPAALIDGDALLTDEPNLSGQGRCALRCPEDASLDPRRLVLLLKTAFLASGGRLHETRKVTALMRRGGRVTGIDMGTEAFSADITILCAGWQTASICPELEFSITPVKGEILGLKAPVPLLRHVIRGAGVYLVPRPGRIVVGATVLPGQTDGRVDAARIADLHRQAAALVPALADLEIDETWAGIRPRTPDDLPILGPAGYDGLWVSAGHFRNGIFWSPATADLLTRHLLDLPGARDIAAFAAHRFKSGASTQAAPPSAASIQTPDR